MTRLNAFQSLYADEIDKNLRNGQNIDDVDLSLSHLKTDSCWLACFCISENYRRCDKIGVEKGGNIRGGFVD